MNSIFINPEKIDHLADSTFEALDFPSVDLTLKLDGLLLSFHARPYDPESLRVPLWLRQGDREVLLKSYNDSMSGLSQRAYNLLLECHSAFSESLFEAVRNLQSPSLSETPHEEDR